MENDNDNVILLKPEFFKHSISAAFVNPPLFEKIVKAQQNDEEWKSTKELANTDEWKTAVFDGWADGPKKTFTYKGKLYIPKSCRAEVVKSCHNPPIAGHPGQWRTLELVQRSYYWPRMAAYIGKYVKGCAVCQRTKTFPAKPQGEL